MYEGSNSILMFILQKTITSISFNDDDDVVYVNLRKTTTPL